MVNWGPHSKVVRLRLITCILPGQPTMGKYYNKSAKLSALFEPTLQSRSMIYTLHGFTAGVFTYIYIYLYLSISSWSPIQAPTKNTLCHRPSTPKFSKLPETARARGTPRDRKDTCVQQFNGLRQPAEPGGTVVAGVAFRRNPLGIPPVI